MGPMGLFIGGGGVLYIDVYTILTIKYMEIIEHSAMT